jgi:hypothetical protein
MVLDALRGYVQLASGLTDVTRQRAVQAARQLVDSGNSILGTAVNSAGTVDFSRQVQGLAEDILATSRTNRDLMVGLVRTEVERSVHRLGLVGADELSAMARMVERLQAQLDAAAAFGERGVARARTPRTSAPQPRTVRRDPVTFGQAPASARGRATKKAATTTVQERPSTTATTASRAPAKTAVKKAPVKKAPAQKGPAKAVVKKAPVKRAPAKAAVKKAPAKRTPAQAAVKKAAARAAVKKAPAKKAPGTEAPAKAAVKKAPVKRAPTRGTAKSATRKTATPKTTAANTAARAAAATKVAAGAGDQS